MKRWCTTVACLLPIASTCCAQTTIQFTAIHALPSNQVELIWSSDTNRWYAIERTADLTNWSNDFEFAIPDEAVSFASNRWALANEDECCFFRLFASSPVGPQDNVYTTMGTDGDDTQIVVGTTNKDYVIQFGEGGNDTQYAAPGAGNDWIAQYGGSGDDDVHNAGSSGNDFAFQDGSDGADSLYVAGLHGNDLIIQSGGNGDDTIRVGPGADDDRSVIRGDDGNDTLRYDLGEGSDTVTIDGGNDVDVLNVHYASTHTFAIRLSDGTDLYTNGIPGTVITVMSLETIHAVEDGTTNWTGSAP